MTGYQEILTDPSYAGQIVTLTYPHIGNVGVNRRGRRIAARARGGPRDPRPAARWRRTSARRATCRRISQSANVVGIADIDTRKLTRILRDKGAQNGCIVAGGTDRRGRGGGCRVAREGGAVDGGPRSREGRVLRRRRTSGRRATWALGDGLPADGRRARFHVVAYDYGVKHNILRMLAERGCRLTVVPAQTPARDVLGDEAGRRLPAATARAIRSLATTRSRRFARSSTPACRRSASASAISCSASRPADARVKMKFGHHGANHPVLDKDTGQVLITSQNHGFAVDPASLPVERARDARVAVRRHDCRASRAPTSRRSASRAIRKRARARTTSGICSTASSSRS